MNISDYAQFRLQDFLEDDFFVQSVINPDENNRSFWQSFASTYPEKAPTVEEAVQIIKLYRTQENFENEESKKMVWQRITDSVKQSEAVKKKRVFRIPVFLRVAAAIVIIAGAATWIYSLYSGNTTTICTKAGEIKTVMLPDHSKVILNGNSTLSYHRGWEADQPREVWIKGEGYFSVQHLNKDSLNIHPSDRFIVHCSEVNIEVLGTTFNVKDRDGKTNVALLTGKIRIDNLDKITAGKALIMAPGDYAEYAGKNLLTSKKLVKTAQIVSWASDELSFTDATVKEITETLRDRYGYTVTTGDTTLLNLKIEGDITVSNVADLLDVVATTLDLKIEQSANKHITISK